MLAVLSEMVLTFWRISTKKDLPQEHPRNTTDYIKQITQILYQLNNPIFDITMHLKYINNLYVKEQHPRTRSTQRVCASKAAC